MTIQQLKYVVALDKHRHFIKASKSCHVAQPTLTLQVKKLEEEICTELFDRRSKPLTTTPMGELFVERAKRILLEIDELKELVNQTRDTMEGEFKIGIIPTLLPYLLPLFITDFVKEFPDTRLIIDELQSDQIIDSLYKKELDIGVLTTPLDEPQIREIPLFYEPFLVYANHNEPILENDLVHANDLDAKGLWLLQKGHCFRNQTLNICGWDQSNQHQNLSIEGGNIETLKRMVQKLSGYTLIPELSYQVGVDRFFVKEFSEPKPVREVSIVVHHHFNKEKLINELRKSILKHIPQHYKMNTKMKMVKWR